MSVRYAAGAVADVEAAALRRPGRLKWETAGPDGLGACAAETDYGTAPPVLAALRAAVDRDVLGYLTPSLAAEAGAACAAWQRESHGWEVSGDDVRLLPDVVRALHVAVEHFSRPGSPVIVPVPAYTPFLVVPRLLGRDVLQVPMSRAAGGRYVLDLDALDAAFAAGGHLLLLCNPHNPTGRVMEPDELRSVCALVTKRQGRVFSDEVHSPLVLAGRRHTPYASLSEAAAHHTLTATSASKAWNLAGLKCAQMLLHNDADRERWARLGRLATDGTATLGAVAAVAAYREGRPWLDAVLARLDRNRRLLAGLLAAHLPEAGHVPPEGTYLGWADLRGLGLPEADLAGFFADRAGVTLVDGRDCGTVGEGFVRINFGTTEAILTRIVERMAAAVAAYRRGGSRAASRADAGAGGEGLHERGGHRVERAVRVGGQGAADGRVGEDHPAGEVPGDHVRGDEGGAQAGVGEHRGGGAQLGEHRRPRVEPGRGAALVEEPGEAVAGRQPHPGAVAQDGERHPGARGGGDRVVGRQDDGELLGAQQAYRVRP